METIRITLRFRAWNPARHRILFTDILTLKESNLFSTAQINRFTNKKNQFVFEDEFRKRVSATSQKIVSSELIPSKKNNSQIALKSEKRHSSLQYYGEILYGIHPVYLALLQKKRKLNQLFSKKDEDLDSFASNSSSRRKIEEMAKEHGIPIRKIDAKSLKYLAPNVVHQGVCLDVGPLPFTEWNKVKKNKEEDSTKTPIWLVLDEILDPMNVGAIIRSSHYFGVQNIFSVKGTSCKLSPTVSKASSGALEVVNIHQIESLEEFIQDQKTHGWEILSTVAYCDHQSKVLGPIIDVSQLLISKPTILILGNEGKGISSEIQKLCDKFISIFPKQKLQHGIDSLNVSVAAGVILYYLSSFKDLHL